MRISALSSAKLRKSFVFAKRIEEKVVECRFLLHKSLFYALFTVTVTFRTYITDV